MAKYYGYIGYGVATETSPGVWSDEPIEKEVYGDIFKNAAAQKSGEHLNDNLTLDMKISFIADPYAEQNYSDIVYATRFGKKWKVESVEIQYPRLVLTLGGVYNG